MGIVLLFVFVTVLFGGMLLMLLFGYESREAERAGQRHNLEAVPTALAGHRFFANLNSGATSEAVPLVPALVIERLEQRLRQEHESVAGFASRPSAEWLLSGYPAYVDAMARELENHIQRERESTAMFLAEPSFESLFGTPGRALRSSHPVGVPSRPAHSSPELTRSAG